MVFRLSIRRNQKPARLSLNWLPILNVDRLAEDITQTNLVGKLFIFSMSNIHFFN